MRERDILRIAKLKGVFEVRRYPSGKMQRVCQRLVKEGKLVRLKGSSDDHSVVRFEPAPAKEESTDGRS